MHRSLSYTDAILKCCAGSTSRDSEIRKQRHLSLMFAGFPNQSPSTNYVGINPHISSGDTAFAMEEE